MNARRLLKLVENLVDEEQCLGQRTRLSARERSRLDRIGTELDRSWCLLWQRQTLPPLGQSPRPLGGGTVDDYWW
jgi:hypothetical protein